LSKYSSSAAATSAQLERHRDDVLRRVLHDQAAGGGLAGERDLGDALGRRERLARFQAEAVDDVEHPRGQQVAHDFHQRQNAHRRLLGRLQHDAVARRERRRDLPHGHQQREVPRDDLAHDAQRLVVVVGDGVVVELRQRAFLRADAGGEVAEVVDGERHVGGERLADRLAVVPRLDQRELLEIGLHAVGDPVQDRGARGGRGLAPGRRSGVRGVEREVDVFFGRARDLAEHAPGHRRDVFEILALDRRNPLAADEVVVLGLEVDLCAGGAGCGVEHLGLLSLKDECVKDLPCAVRARGHERRKRAGVFRAPSGHREAPRRTRLCANDAARPCEGVTGWNSVA
jgi:ParB family chromosome partitioning protein